MSSEWNLSVMLRWQWWIVVILLSPMIAFVLLMILLEYVFDYLSDVSFSLSRFFGRVGDFKTPRFLKKMLKFAKGE